MATLGRLTTLKGEVLHTGNPLARFTTLKGEVLHTGQPKARLSTLKAEVIYSLAVPPAYASGTRRLVFIISA